MMYEFLFSITHEKGGDRYTDAFIEHDSLRSDSVYSCLSPERMWHLETVTGDPDSVGLVRELILEESVGRASISERECQADRQRSLLTDEPDRLVVYSYFSEVGICDAVPVIAAQYVSGGLLIEETRRGKEAHWRLLLQDEEKVGMLYDTLGARLTDGMSFRFGHLTEVDNWERGLLSRRRLPNEQLETLAIAFERGYFETPREITLDELAEHLDTPRSTVSYRLRRAVAQLTEAFMQWNQYQTEDGG
jgi:predicted DNA binding protein